ncbi:MAG: sugar phosphate isomerase/epimerase family protein [Phycisphaeraceae bacterium]
MPKPQPSRRAMLHGAAAAAVGVPAMLAGESSAKAASASAPRPMEIPSDRRIFKSLKLGMVNEPNLSLVEKFEMLREIGFDGVEFDSPGVNIAEAIDARDRTGLMIEGTVNNVHWHTRLSDPDPEVRERSYEAMIKALHETRAIGGHSMLLVPGQVTDPETENQEQVWERSIEYIHRALPTAAYLGVYIGIENVWNSFNYTHDGATDQSADMFVKYIDAINSPWVAMHFDIGNHQRYGNQPEWIRALGSQRIVKLDIKDWSTDGGWKDIGNGDVPWPEVRKALDEIGFTGWAAAEVGGGNRDRLKQISEQMDRNVLGL